MLNASPTAIDFDVYQPRNPKASAYYHCVEVHLDQLEAVFGTNVIRAVLVFGGLELRRIKAKINKKWKSFSFDPLIKLFLGRDDFQPPFNGLFWDDT